MRSYPWVCWIALALIPSAALAQDNNRPRADLRGHQATIRSVSFSPDGKRLISAASEGPILEWDVEKLVRIRDIAPRGRVVDGSSSAAATPRRVECAAFSPDGMLIAEAAADTPNRAAVRLWTAEDGELARELPIEARSVRCVAFAPDGESIAVALTESGELGAQIVLYDPLDGAAKSRWRSEKVSPTTMAFSPDGSLLATASATRLHLWDVAAGKLAREITGHTKGIQALAFSPDGAKLATAAGDDPVRVWTVADGKMVREIAAKQDGTYSVAFSPTGKTLVTGGGDATVKLFNPETGILMGRLWGHRGRVTALEYSRDGKTLASGGQDQLIALWNTNEADQKEIKETKTEEEFDKKEEKLKKLREHRRKEEEKRRQREGRP